MMDYDFLDQVKRLAIIAMFSDDELMDRLVLKGGNLLDVVYSISSRASMDVDMSIDGSLDDVDDLEGRIVAALSTTFKDIHFIVFDVRCRAVPPKMTPDMAGFWGGYKVEFKIIEKHLWEQLQHDHEKLQRNAASVGKRGSTKFTIDLSNYEYCADKVPYDLDNYRIYVYSPQMVVAEKLRAVCQQMPEYVSMMRNHPSARARDFIDIHTVITRKDVELFTPNFSILLRAMFATKRVPIMLLEKISATRDFHRPDFIAVKATLRPDFDAKEFDFYFDYVVDLTIRLKPFWDV